MAANDVRGWVMSTVSGVACVLGSGIICVDIIVRHITRDKKFQIANSNNFLSASLCLSAGVMLFTSLYSMLPTSKEYLTRAGHSSSASAYILTGLFIGGVVVIRIASGFLHRFIPSHVVDCAHTHDGPEDDPERGEQMQDCDDASNHPHAHSAQSAHEQTPLLRPAGLHGSKSTSQVTPQIPGVSSAKRQGSLRASISRRISSLMDGVKHRCDENGPCYGFSQTCGQECTKVLVPTPTPLPSGHGDFEPRPELLPSRHSLDGQLDSTHPIADNTNLISALATSDEEHLGVGDSGLITTHTPTSSSSSHTQRPIAEHDPDAHKISDDHSSHQHHHECQEGHNQHEHDDAGEGTSKADPIHHHHVPQNAFLSIGLQTSLAIALHKLPEGFITFATNHASPKLGLTVFLALFIHNIVEGFAMALPLYLALNSRWKAMFWSSILGGISQPAGAGIAAVWFWSSGRKGSESVGPSWGVYGGMFAVTAGVMTSVALQLFSEGLGLTHHRNMGMAFAVVGMGLMGFSFALTA
ncbi:hypothetical protein N7539_005658 [Penicillium diatomitis]|uniref:Zinc/iron permease n=1 Tax=Penicillium diatomitis TaxID=2819901 RepID=A0A9X0BVH3_9EURO|nr:uncharacterized protein N7539_005658 [Penicillium diatomitis]KAJ5485670.1 hypothetical protein N7539_005658 [Penicillium diatomitis]